MSRVRWVYGCAATALLSILLASLSPAAIAAPSSAAPDATGCVVSKLRVYGGSPGAPPIGPQSFLRVANADGSFRELLELPQADHSFISTEGLIPAPESAHPLPCSIVTYDYTRSPSLSGEACPPYVSTVIDDGPTLQFSGAARAQKAVVRVIVRYNKTFGDGIYNIDESVTFGIDDTPAMTLPARGIEPVYVTATFPHLTPGPHRISYAVGGLEQGVVCI